MEIASFLTFKIPFKINSPDGPPSEDALSYFKELKIGRHSQFCFMLPHLFSVTEIFLPEQAEKGVFFYEVTDNELLSARAVSEIAWTAPGLSKSEKQFALGSMTEHVELIQNLMKNVNEQVMSYHRQMALAQAGRGIVR